MVFDLNVTSRCNLACTYCSEGNECGLSSIVHSDTKVDINDLFKFMELYPEEPIEIFFWGGEPFLNFDYCLEVINKYKNQKNVGFYFYTNGMYIKRYKKELEQISKEVNGTLRNGRPRLHIQVSYDGDPINSIERIDKKGLSVSSVVKENFKLIKELGISTSMKSVIVARSFKHIFEAFKDVVSVDFNYSPTPDSFSDMTWEEFEPYLKELEVGVSNIAKYIYENNLRPEKFAWFSESKKLCGAGKDYYSIDLNGDLSPCHGCMYRETNIHKVGNILDENIKDVLKETTEQFKSGHGYTTDCMQCDTLFCLKCPVGCFDKSEQENYFDKWSDANANWQMCAVFKTSDKIHKALRYALSVKGK